MEYITTKDTSAKWGISTTRITILANEGRIPGAKRLGKSWLIPANATKPPMLKANHSGTPQKETINFSFPLYHFRPDWSYINEASLSTQQKQLLKAEKAVVECRFTDAYPLLKSILQAPNDIYIEIGCLWNAGICCIGLNKPTDYSRFYMRLKILLSRDFPYRDDLTIILDTLNTYVDTIDSATKYNVDNIDINDQCLPLICLQNGYSIMTKEIMNPGTADTNMLEINLRFINTTSAVIVSEMLHLYLLGIYSLRQDMESANKHAKHVVEIAYENKYFLPLVTYYSYFSSILSPIIQQYPEEFQRHCHKLITTFEENFSNFLLTKNDHAVISKLNDADYPYIYAVLMNLHNNLIAEKLGVSERTVKRRLDMICEKLGVNSKKALKEYLHNNM